MSAFPTFPRGKPITNEEARAVVETELFAMELTKPMTPAEKDAFCEIAKSRLNYESNSYRIKEIRLWVESWQSLWLPEKLGASVGMVDTAASEFARGAVPALDADHIAYHRRLARGRGSIRL